MALFWVVVRNPHHRGHRPDYPDGGGSKDLSNVGKLLPDSPEDCHFRTLRRETSNSVRMVLLCFCLCELLRVE